jgi:hypothetical protein
MAQLLAVQMLSIDLGIENNIPRLYFSHISEPYIHVFSDSCHILSKEKIYMIVLQNTEFYYMGITNRSFGNLFATLNIWNPRGKCHKCPSSKQNKNIWRREISQEINYMKSLYNNVTAAIDFFYRYMKYPEITLKYWFTYKMSKDQLFCTIRGRSGWCLNPSKTVSQLVIFAHKWLLIRYEINFCSENFSMLNTTKILNVSSATKNPRFDLYDAAIFSTYKTDRVKKI